MKKIPYVTLPLFLLSFFPARIHAQEDSNQFLVRPMRTSSHRGHGIGERLMSSVNQTEFEVPICDDSLFDQSEGMVVTSPTDPSTLLSCFHWVTGAGVQLGYGISLDGGSTWTRDKIPNIIGFDPTVAIDRNGTYYYAAMQYGWYVSYVTVFTSSDDGGAWTRSVLDSLGGDKPWMVVDNSGMETDGTVYIAWVQNFFLPHQLKFSKKGPLDTEFSEPTAIDIGNGGTVPQGISMAVTANGTLVISYIKINFNDVPNTFDLYVMRSTDGGISFSTPEIINHDLWWTRSWLDRGIDVFPGLTSLALEPDGETANVVVAEPTEISYGLYYGVYLYRFNIFDPVQTVVKETVAADPSRWRFYPSVTAHSGRTVVAFTTAIRGASDGGMSGIQQYVVERVGENAYAFLDTLLAVPQNTWDYPDDHYTHHYNGVALADNRVIAVFTDYRNPTNDFWSGRASLVTSVPLAHETPLGYKLAQNYPNPFNPGTMIEFFLPTSSVAKLNIFNALGESVSILIDGEMDEGMHQVHFDASRLPSGVYWYRLTTDVFTETKRMLLVK